jgi:protein-tyrosine-phosphatase
VKRARVLVDAARALRGTVRPEHPSEDDIPDPYRMDIERFRAAMRDIDACLVVLVDRLSGLDRAAPAQGE